MLVIRGRRVKATIRQCENVRCESEGGWKDGVEDGFGDKPPDEDGEDTWRIISVRVVMRIITRTHQKTVLGRQRSTKGTSHSILHHQKKTYFGVDRN